MTLPKRIGVVGGGRMGAGIAHAFAVAGATVTVVETEERAVAAARERLAKSAAAAEARGALDTSADEVTSRLSVQVGLDALEGCDLVVESVPENIALKHRVLADVEAVAPGAVLATNTSALSIDALAAELARPHRFLGLHFFNPVPASSRPPARPLTGDASSPCAPAPGATPSAAPTSPASTPSAPSPTTAPTAWPIPTSSSR